MGRRWQSLYARAHRLRRSTPARPHPGVTWASCLTGGAAGPRYVTLYRLRTGMEPEEGTPLWRLQKLPAERGLQLLHKIIDGLCGQAYPLYQDYHSVWDSAEWNHVLEDITKFFKAVVGKNLSDEEVFQQLNQLNSLHQEAVMKCLKSRKDEIKKTLLEEIVDISSAQLQDFDWQLKLALSSDKIATLQMPLLNLHLDVKENGEVKPYSIEMNKEELQNLINSLEAANKVVRQLK